MKKENWKIALSVLTLLISILSSSIGYGFMEGTDISFSTKFTCGMVFMATPLLVVQLLILLWKKDQ